MKNGKYEVGDWVKSSDYDLDITVGKSYQVVGAGERGFYVLDDVDDENWSSHGDVDWSPCSPEHQYKVGDWVKVIDNSTPGWVKKLIAAGSVVKILHPAWMEGGWLLEGDERFIYTEKQIEPAEAPAPAWAPTWVPKVGDKVRIVRKVEREYGWDNTWAPKMDRLVADGVDYTVSGVNRWGVNLAGADHFGWPVGSLELIKEPTQSFKVGDRVSFKERARDGAERLTGTVTSVDENGFPNECRRDDGEGWGDDSRWAVCAHYDLQMIAEPTHSTADPTPPITAAAPNDGHIELRLTISLDTSAFADKLQRIVDAIRAAA